MITAQAEYTGEDWTGTVMACLAIPKNAGNRLVSKTAIQQAMAEAMQMAAHGVLVKLGLPCVVEVKMEPDQIEDVLAISPQIE